MVWYSHFLKNFPQFVWSTQSKDLIVNKVKVKVKLLSRVWLFCDSMDCSLPGSTVHGILQARIQEWVAIPFSRGSSWPRDQTWVSCLAERFFTVWATREAYAPHSPLTFYPAWNKTQAPFSLSKILLGNALTASSSSLPVTPLSHTNYPSVLCDVLEYANLLYS